MTITGIFGAIGSGKSWLQMNYALSECNKKKKRLVTNFFLNLDALWSWASVKKYDYILELIDTGGIIYINSNQSLASLLSISKAVVCLDEAGVFLNSRQYQDTPKELLQDLCQSRKDGVDLIYAAQFTKQVDAQIRALTQFVYHCRGFTKYNYLSARPELLMKNFFLFDAETYDQWVVSRHKNNPIKTRFAFAAESCTGPLSCVDQDLFKCFDSMARLDRQNHHDIKFNHGKYKAVNYSYMRESSPDYDNVVNDYSFDNSTAYHDSPSDNGSMGQDRDGLKDSDSLNDQGYDQLGLFAAIAVKSSNGGAKKKSNNKKSKSLTITESVIILVSEGNYRKYNKFSLAISVYRFLGAITPAVSRQGVDKICLLIHKSGLSFACSNLHKIPKCLKFGLYLMAGQFILICLISIL